MLIYDEWKHPYLLKVCPFELQISDVIEAGRLKLDFALTLRLNITVDTLHFILHHLKCSN